MTTEQASSTKKQPLVIEIDKQKLKELEEATKDKMKVGKAGTTTAASSVAQGVDSENMGSLPQSKIKDKNGATSKPAV